MDLPGKHPHDRIEHGIQFLAYVLGKKAQHEVAVLLQQLVLASIATIDDRIREVLSAVEFDGYAGVGAQQVDFKCSEAVMSRKLRSVCYAEAAAPTADTAFAASRMDATTASGSDTLSACEAPAISRVPFAFARFAMKRWSSAGMMRSFSPNTNHEGIVFHAGVSVGSGPVRATSVAGRCVAPIRAA